MQGIGAFRAPGEAGRWRAPCADRTHTEDSCEVTDAPPDLAARQAELAAWEVCYNTIRPHQALGYLTPAEYLASIGIDVKV